MKEQDLFKKWLDHDLEKKALEAFEKSDAFTGFQKLHKAAQHYKSPEFNIAENLASITSTLENKKQKPVSIYRIISGLAAVFIACFGLFYFLNSTTLTTYIAENGEQKEVKLPDTSNVQLNAKSSISFNEDSWNSTREISLKGEAYFKVAKGKTFTVTTAQGVVTVLGTQFIVKNRPGYFEVICYEGEVKVDTQNKTFRLTQGKRILLHNSLLQSSETLASKPSWIDGRSIFNSIPLEFVLNEMERQYNITIKRNMIDTSIHYTGNFTHNNLNTALQSITIPLHLDFEINGTEVSLKKK